MREVIMRLTPKEIENAERDQILQELVRCRDCKWYEIYQLKKDGTEDRRFKPDLCVLHSRNFPAEYFCADGERKGEEK